MELLYLVSRYLGDDGEYSVFHFIGYYNGMRISKVKIQGGSFAIDEDYVLAVDYEKCVDQVLYGNLVRSKRIF